MSDINSEFRNHVFFQTVTFTTVAALVYFAMYAIQSVVGFGDMIFYLLVTVSVFLLSYHFTKTLAKPLFDSKKDLEIYIKNTLHELNIPISTIDANVELLRKNMQSEKDIKRISRIKQASYNLQELYKELEYMLKKESGNTPIERFEVEEFLKRVVSKFDDIKKDIKIYLECEEGIYLECDKRGLCKVAENLISNALKFNKKEGFVKIRFKNAKLSIEDSGIGIDNQNLFMIFERYYTINRAQKGHGIGLSIVKEYCDKNKIDIKITSQKEQGTKITLDLSSIVNT